MDDYSSARSDVACGSANVAHITATPILVSAQPPRLTLRKLLFIARPYANDFAPSNPRKLSFNDNSSRTHVDYVRI